MNPSGQLVWMSNPRSFDDRRKVYFAFSPGFGLTDIDFHPITNKNWQYMTAPSPDAVAMLEVPAEATMAQLNAAVQTIATKGGYLLIALRGTDPPASS